MDKCEMKVLGNKIKELRQEAGLTQRELAYMVGVSESAMRSYELGDRAPKDRG